MAQTGSGNDADWGPLAVMHMNGGTDALNAGVLRIGGRCVVLETAGGESELLVWLADRTRWDAADGTIGFTNTDGSQFTLRDGQAVSFGGSGDSTAESGVSSAEGTASVDWIAPPDASCPMEIRWYVSEVGAQGNAADPASATPASTPLPSADLVGISVANPSSRAASAPFSSSIPTASVGRSICRSPYQREFRGDVMVIVGSEGEVIARTGDRVADPVGYKNSISGPAALAMIEHRPA